MLVKNKVKKHEESMAEWTNKKLTFIIDNLNIDNTKSVKEFTPRSGFNVQILLTYHQDHNNDEFYSNMRKKMIL